MIGIVIPGADIFRLSLINLFVVLLPDISSSPPDPVDDVMNVLSEGTLHLFVPYNCWPKITLFRHWHWNCNIPEKTKSKFPNNYIILFCVFLLLRTWMPQLFISSSDVPTWYLSTRQLYKNGEFDCWNWNFEKAYSRIIVSSPFIYHRQQKKNRTNNSSCRWFGWMGGTLFPGTSEIEMYAKWFPFSQDNVIGEQEL